MKKLLAIILSILAIVSLLSVVSLAKTAMFEDDYIAEGDFVLASLSGTKPFFADAANPEPVEDACYWLSDYASALNLKYVSFIGYMSSGPNYTYPNFVQTGKGNTTQLYEVTMADEEWRRDFVALKNTATILTDMEVPYGISINLNDYCSNGFDRRNHVQSTFDYQDLFGDADIKYESYDINNFYITFKIGNETYIVYQLEAFPQNYIINWFNSVQSMNQDKRAIVFTTSFLDAKGEMYTQHNWTENPTYAQWGSIYGKYNTHIKTNMLNNNQPHDGDQLWLDAFSKWDNLMLIVSGNANVGTNIVTKNLKNENGHDVVAVVTSLIGGYASSNKAYPVLFKISADNKTVDIRYAEPYYNKVGGYVEESKTVITLNNLADLPDPDPVTLLDKISAQSNGANKAYINGYAGNLFKPNANMTKAEACTIFARILLGTQDIPSGYTTRFTDVKEGDWYYNAIAYLDQNGYFFTTEGDTYNPNAKITRAEFVELAYFTSELAATQSISFKDVDESNKYYNAITAAAASGLVNGYGDGTFGPDKTITRAEVVTVINRLLSLIADEKTVSKDNLDVKFSDIAGHWAEYQILLASNSNVKTSYYYNSDLTSLKEDKTTIWFENDYLKVVIAKKDGKVTSMINKMTGEEVGATTTTPWFSWIINNSGANIEPKKVELIDGQLVFTYKNGISASIIVQAKEHHFEVILNSNVPASENGIVICSLVTNAPWALDDENAFGLSAMPMTTKLNSASVPGGSSKSIRGTTYTYLGVPTLGARIGFSFSRMTEHREHLKDIAAAIDRSEGLTSTMGGPYALDRPDQFTDYVILSSGLTPDNAVETAALAHKYSVEYIDMHQGGGTFIQADFNFVCARNEQEKEKGTFITADVFKERIADVLAKDEVYLGLHTYSSLVATSAKTILTNPEYQKQICYDPKTYTVRGNLSRFRTNIKTNEDASGFKYGEGNAPWNGPYTKYILIDEEIILVQQGTSSGFLNVKRGQLGTQPAAHEDGAEIRQFLGHYGMFQPIPLSDLFYKIAEDTGRACSEGGFKMIYLDGFESFARDALSESRMRFYIYGEFARTIMANVDEDPLMEYSAGSPSYLWAARGRGGATDCATRAYKNHKIAHIKSQSSFHNSFYTATVGWFNYDNDASSRYHDTTTRTLHRDDLDVMGSLALAHDFSTVCQPFSIASFNAKTRLSDNFMYYGLYTRLREGQYFSPEVKKAILASKYEFKVFKQEDGSWAFKEMKYFKNKVMDASLPAFLSGKGTNPFGAQTPFIRIEQRFSTEGKEGDGVVIKEFDETKPVTSYVGKHTFPELNASGKTALKIRVFGNGSTTDAILISLRSVVTSEAGRHDYFIPLNFTGWREIILLEVNNDDYAGYSFSGISTGSINYETYRAGISFGRLNSVQITTTGSCAGVMIDDLVGYTPADAPVKNPSVTIGGQTITFDAELHSGDFIEYYPEYNQAYHNYFAPIYDEEGNWTGSEARVEKINHTGTVTVPAGDFTYTYGGEAQTDLITRAQTVIGVSGAVLENPADWVEPEIDMPVDIEKPALY